MYDLPDPIIIKRQCGGYLAHSPKNARIKIGVTADTRTDVLSKFRARYETWLDKPQPDYQI